MRLRETAQEADVAVRLRAALAGARLVSAADVGARLGGLVREGLLDLPRPGGGATAERFEALAEIAACDLSLARLAEGHVDAAAIRAELGAPPRDGLYGVWAAESERDGAVLHATRTPRGYRLRGTKPYASGARSVTRALVTARTSDGPRLFDVDVGSPGVSAVAGTWRAVGMAHSDSLHVVFDDVDVSENETLGGVGGYVARPGFWQGGVGVAACWLGGAVGCVRMLTARFAQTSPDAHALAHLGAAVASVRAMASSLACAAEAIDADPRDTAGRGEARALEVRAIVEALCQEVLARTGRASGSSALVFDDAHARRAADLVVYLRQHHAERDLHALGARTSAPGPDSWP